MNNPETPWVQNNYPVDSIIVDQSGNTTLPDLFQFNGKEKKTTLDNENFFSFKGLRMYLITGKKEKAFLQPEVNSHYKLDYGLKYQYVDGLTNILRDTLLLNLNSRPFVLFKAKSFGPLVLSGANLTIQEKEWFEIVCDVIKSIKQR
ncbi:hypothetical protein RVBP14_2090 [Pseudomonas phage sp. Brmt]|nr:hypothetical protein RVBP14_2090 [Pseudomonas phage sp. Brmt]